MIGEIAEWCNRPLEWGGFQRSLRISEVCTDAPMVSGGTRAVSGALGVGGRSSAIPEVDIVPDAEIGALR